MPAICLYFQIHQPFRLRRYTAFDSSSAYFDDHAHHARAIEQIAGGCYLPATQILLELIQKHHGRFRFALSITGTGVELLEAHAPEVMRNLHALANSGGVEILGETYHHSLASLYSPTEFADQVSLHRAVMKRLFGQSPSVFRNTELIYSDAIAQFAAKQNFAAILAEGALPLLANRSAAFLYRGPNANLALLLRNDTLSNSLSLPQAEPPAELGGDGRAESFVQAVSQIGGQLCNLFLPLESIAPLEFLREFPSKLLAANHKFLLPSEIAAADALQHSAGSLSIPEPICWSSGVRQPSAELGANTLAPWLGNAMQQNAAAELYKLESAVKGQSTATRLLDDWRKLTASDHFLHMSTYPTTSSSPDDSPYDAYINFMNVLDNLRARL
ncbi:MAG: hypothetical protein FWD61_16115 [Phycisphaerales bacterium]|nr:hypothetical protein [Phycisphaerales bacterium]